MNNQYTQSRFNCVRMKTREVKVGNIGIGKDNPLRIQSMTNTKTLDVDASVKQCIQLAETGCDIIRLTAQNVEAARALKDINKKFKAAGFTNPLVADIHFLPQAAMEAVEHVEKVRINPGNFADRKTGKLDYTDKEYNEELERVRERFLPFLKRCKELGRAIRLGTNHGSLSDRIINRYADTPLGMVEAALEFVRICEAENFKDVVLSFKASNTRVMTQAYRLAAKKMAEEGLDCPLHLGVTEAGFGKDARIKSAMGIGGLLLDGIGDTIRVSLTEDPVKEVPVAIELAKFVEKFRAQKPVEQIDEGIDFYSYSKRESFAIDLGDKLEIGGNSQQTVCVNGKSDKAEICFDNSGKCKNFEIAEYKKGESQKLKDDLNSGKKLALKISNEDLQNEFIDVLKNAPKNFAVISPKPVCGRHFVGETRRTAAILKKEGINAPIFIMANSDVLTSKTPEEKLNEASIYLGALLCDGIGDLELVEVSSKADENAEDTLAILQAARARRSKAEYIACPSCGRTLYNIQETAKKIEARTKHLKDVTIGIMGCIVNGPGEMADADFGYVGGAPGKINLYKGKQCVKMNIPQENAIDELLKLIEQYKPSGK